MTEKDHLRDLSESTNRMLDMAKDDTTEKKSVPTPPDFSGPPEVQVQVDADDAEYARLDKQAQWTEREQRRKVGGTALTAEDIEEIENERLAAEREAAKRARYMVKQKPKARSRSRRRGYDPKGGGPPAHISAEIRGK